MILNNLMINRAWKNKSMTLNSKSISILLSTSLAPFRLKTTSDSRVDKDVNWYQMSQLNGFTDSGKNWRILNITAIPKKSILKIRECSFLLVLQLALLEWVSTHHPLQTERFTIVKLNMEMRKKTVQIITILTVNLIFSNLSIISSEVHTWTFKIMNLAKNTNCTNQKISMKIREKWSMETKLMVKEILHLILKLSALDHSHQLFKQDGFRTDSCIWLW